MFQNKSTGMFFSLFQTVTFVCIDSVPKAQLFNSFHLYQLLLWQHVV